MPLLRRKPFTPRPLPPNLNPDADYFVCKATGEVFDDYEAFFERVIVCNSLVWTCSVTGRPGLTYPEAKACEEKALGIIDRFPQHLRGPVLFLATLTHRTRINDLNEDVYVYIRDVYFKNEVIEAIHEDEWWEGKVVDTFLAPEEEDEEKDEEIGADEPDWDHIRYKVRLWDDETNEYIPGDDGLIVVDTSCIRREKNGLHSINQDKCKMFLKYHSELVDTIWRVKKAHLAKYNITDATFSEFICLPEPKFIHSKAIVKKHHGGKSRNPRRTEEDMELIRDAKRLAKEVKEANVKEVKNKVKKEAKDKVTPEQKAAQRFALKERLRIEREKLREEAALKHAEEKVRLREMREQERLRAREEKKQLADKLREWNKPRDDLLCDDLAVFPTPALVPPLLAPYFGDIVMVVEFLSVFGENLSLENSFPEGVTIDLLQSALFESDINGPLSDLLCFFLSAIFACIEEEEEMEAEGQLQDGGRAELIDETTEPGELSYKELIISATAASQISQFNHGTSLKGFQLDPLTVSEVLRLHLLASGAKGSSASVKFRYQSRGGYSSLDDAGIALKKDRPHILNSLATGNVFDLEVGDKLAIISTLINQLLTYASLRDVIEESMDQNKSLSYELKQIQWAEQRREREETQLRHKKRLEQKLHYMQQIQPAVDAPEKMEVEVRVKVEVEVKIENGEQSTIDTVRLVEQPPGSSELANAANNSQNEEASREARRIAKRIINDTSKLDPNRVPADTGRSRRKNAPADDFNWREYDMAEWNNLEERYLTEEDTELLQARRKEIETRQKQDYLDREAEMYDSVNELGSRVATHSLGQDRWGRTYWSFNSIPNLFIERLESDLITQPTDLDGSLHSEKENNMPSKSANSSQTNLNGLVSLVSLDNKTSNEEYKATLKNTVLENDPSYAEDNPWAYYDSSEQLDEVVSALNNRGFRESVLKQKVITRRRKIQQLHEQHSDFSLDEHSIHETSKPVAATNQNIKSRSRIAKGLVQNTSAQESLELNLREMLLDLEERIFVGGLGSMKISNRATWRGALESGSYLPQDKELSILTVQDIDPSDGDSLVVRDLLRALLQLQRAVEAKYLCKPLGFAEAEKKRPGPKKSKKEEVVEPAENQTDAEPVVRTVDRWSDSLLASTSLSQIFLHMCTLESSIVWSKSALNARCRLCRRKGDGEKMLLCDMCDRGHHMYCLKPPVKDVPRGDWFCPECRPKQVRSRRASYKKAFYQVEEEEAEEEEEEEEEEESGEEETENSGTDNSVYDEETAGSSEEEPKHPKIKLLKATVGRPKGSGRSSPASSASGKDSKVRRSRTSTPEVESGRYRRSAAPSPEAVPSRRSKGSSKLAAEGSAPRKSRGSRPSSPHEGGSRNSLGSARSNLSEEVAQLAQCEEVVKELMEMEDCWPFVSPVNRREVPDYYTIIKRPMDCQTILSRVKMVKYTNVSEMISDIRLMFKNCTIYNETTSDIYKMGEKVSRYFEKQVKALRLEANTAKRAKRT